MKPAASSRWQTPWLRMLLDNVYLLPCVARWFYIQADVLYLEILLVLVSSYSKTEYDKEYEHMHEFGSRSNQTKPIRGNSISDDVWFR